ncbi:MAG: D-alanine--D-alanine ligase [Mycobacteriales bacterium]
MPDDIDGTGRVAVIAGGLSHERAVSLSSGRRAVRELRARGVDVHLYDVDPSLLDRLSKDGVDVAYLAVHGAGGEDGVLQSVLEILDLPFVGSPSRACRLAWDKAHARAMLERAGILVPDWLALPSEAFRELGSARLLEAIRQRLPLPLVVKPSTGGSAQGITGVDSDEELPNALIRSFGYGDTSLVERLVDGLDVAIGIVERDGVPVPLPAVSLAFDGASRFDFSARYSADQIIVDAPAALPADLTGRLQSAAVKAHVALGLRHLSRADFVVTPDGDARLLEVAISPGLTETSLFPIALEANGETLGSVLHYLLCAAVADRRGGSVAGP